ncbi:MAG TPA: GNAT family N-acetyltransferase [Ignavibacteria bacterium]|nr:GNAT family N-acetyltransferase [Ignavibacteria bacterium]
MNTFEQLDFTNNTARSRYELVTDGHISYVEYMLPGRKMILSHTEVPKALEGKGVGSKIIKLVLEDAKKLGLKVIPLCPFAASYIRRHPEWNSVLDDDVNLK